MSTNIGDADPLMLLLSKDLYRRASDIVREAGRFSHGVAVSLLHDAAEILARSAATEIGAGAKRDESFLNYWDSTNQYAKSKGLPQQLKHKNAMDDLNEARRLFKHRGKTPDPIHMGGFLATTHSFLQDTTQDFFGIDFDSISSVTFVREIRVRGALEAAQAALATQDVQAALNHCADAWAVTASQQEAFFPSYPGRGITISYDDQVKLILSATRGEFAHVFDQIHLLARITFAALLGMNVADVTGIISTLPIKHNGAYIYPTPVDAVPTERVAHIIELIADNSTGLMKHIDGFMRPEWSDREEGADD